MEGYHHPQLDEILRELHSGLQALYGERLSQVILYGSQARGDAEEYSDIDVMIVLKGDFDDDDENRRVSHLVAAISLQYNTVVSRIFFSEKEFQTHQSGLMRNIQAEGVPVL